MPAMKRYDVVHKNHEWKAQQNGRTVPGTVAKTKQAAVKQTAVKARAAATPAAPISTRIHKLNGQIQEERTYPGGADPKRRKG